MEVFMTMGLGQLGNQNITFRHKLRWTLALYDTNWNVISDREYVKVVARPSLNIEEVELGFLKSKSWIPWETMTLTYFDGKKISPILAKISSSPPSKFYSVLELYEGCGNLVERWQLNDCFITSLNWGELDYSDIEEQIVEMQMRYSSAKYEGAEMGIPMQPFVPDTWIMPKDWKIVNPITCTEGEMILNRFLGASN